jgi:hypothetical protein
MQPGMNREAASRQKTNLEYPMNLMRSSFHAWSIWQFFYPAVLPFPIAEGRQNHFGRIKFVRVRVKRLVASG